MEPESTARRSWRLAACQKAGAPGARGGRGSGAACLDIFEFEELGHVRAADNAEKRLDDVRAAVAAAVQVLRPPAVPLRHR